MIIFDVINNSVYVKYVLQTDCRIKIIVFATCFVKSLKVIHVMAGYEY